MLATVAVRCNAPPATGCETSTGGQGLEPRTSAPKTEVIPFHQPPFALQELHLRPAGYEPAALLTELRTIRKAGIEPATSRLSGVRSNRLSYSRLALEGGIEPPTSRLTASRSTS